MTDFLQRLGIDLPIIQAPMAGTSTPALAAAVCEAGALGSIGVGATDAAGAAQMIAETRARTRLTDAISGRPARCLVNAFTALGEDFGSVARPDYPIAYDAGKALAGVAKAQGDFGYGAQWAGQGAPLARSMPAADLVATLADEWRQSIGR